MGFIRDGREGRVIWGVCLIMDGWMDGKIDDDGDIGDWKMLVSVEDTAILLVVMMVGRSGYKKATFGTKGLVKASEREHIEEGFGYLE